jgi:hypothetical protein
MCILEGMMVLEAVDGQEGFGLDLSDMRELDDGQVDRRA